MEAREQHCEVHEKKVEESKGEKKNDAAAA